MGGKEIHPPNTTLTEYQTKPKRAASTSQTKTVHSSKYVYLHTTCYCILHMYKTAFKKGQNLHFSRLSVNSSSVCSYTCMPVGSCLYQIVPYTRNRSWIHKGLFGLCKATSTNFHWMKHQNPNLQYCNRQYLSLLFSHTNSSSNANLPLPPSLYSDNPTRQTKRPPVTQKLSKTTSHSSPSTSPPLPRRRSEDTRSPSPPPPPLPPSGQRRQDVAMSSEYVMLEHTHTLDPLGMFYTHISHSCSK